MQVKRRPHGLELKRANERARRMATHQINQQRGDQRAVHDQAGVGLHLRHVLAVIVDAPVSAMTGVGAGSSGLAAAL